MAIMGFHCHGRMPLSQYWSIDCLLALMMIMTIEGNELAMPVVVAISRNSRRAQASAKSLATMSGFN